MTEETKHDAHILFQEIEWAMKSAIDKFGEIVRAIPNEPKYRLQRSAGQNLLWEMNFTAAKCKNFEKEYTGRW